MTTAGIPLLGALTACDRAITEVVEAENPTSTDWVNLRTARELARRAIEVSVCDTDELLAACKAARDLYDHLSLGKLVGATNPAGVAMYGSNYKPPTDEDCLAVRKQLQTAIAGF